MIKIIVNEDCGNAPKKLFLKDFIVGAVKNDSAFVARNVTDDIIWNIINGKHIAGKDEVLTEVRQSRSVNVVELMVNTIVTHGYDGVVNGQLKFKDGKTVAFCDIYRFRSPTNNAPIKMITTFAVTLQ